MGLLVRLGRQVLAGPVADSGMLPASYYRHLALEALEAEDFPGALRYLKWAADPLLAQIMVFRLRLLSARHRRQREALQDLLDSESSAERREHYKIVVSEETRALGLLQDYEVKAMAQLGGPHRAPPA